ncbi:rh blood group, D antigen [Anguilla anguilla]|uniref:rh blood group, D antigen n=1 Tax=Anguilla anguilla TaxID=7936 RepID=UPI0015B21720|nr:rh blood group, D antigen [Anguilla anguilla]
MMAPKYAPSLRGYLPPMTLLLETTFISLFAFFVEYEDPAVIRTVPLTDVYAAFQDVNAMVLLGFGFLASFLVRYSFSGTAFTLLVTSLAVQWAVLVDGFLFAFRQGKIHIGMNSLATANLCAASALISMGAVLGKTNPAHLMIMALLEVTGFMVNRWILQTFLRVQPVDAVMLLHVFGACFGLMVSWVLYRSGLGPRHEKETTDRRTGLFAALGALFLWMFWPSFNSVLISRAHPESKLQAISSTYLSLATSTVAAFLVSVVTHPRGKINMIHIQNASLAGGVAVGVAVSAVDVPWVAMVIGLSAGVVSTLGFRYLKPHLQLVFKFHDTCGVLSVHGMPGILGWAAYFLIQMVRLSDITEILEFTVFHLCTLLLTLSLSLGLGALTGFLIKWNLWRPPQDRKCFDDQAYWEFPHLAERK